MSSFQGILQEVSSSSIRPGSQREKAILEILEGWFLQDFPVGRSPYRLTDVEAKYMASIRAMTWMKLFSKGRADQLKEDMRQAHVSHDSMLRMLNHECPLAFEGRRQLHSMMRAIAGAIKRDLGSSDFKVIITGSGTTFYSENPRKQGHFFDREARSGSKAGDIDVGIACSDVRKIQQHFGNIRPNYLGGAMWGSNLTLQAFPSLQDFYMEWGNHPYVRIGTGSQKRYNRDIGIVTYNLDWHEVAPYSRFWRKDYVYDAATDEIKESQSFSGGGKLCRYGRACTRPDCCYEHP